MNITLTPVHEVDNIWPAVSPMLAKVFDRAPGYLSLGELWQMCRSGNAYLLIAHDTEIKGASIWQFQRGYGQDIFTCVALAGKDLKSWLRPVFDAAREMARSGGATAVTATGRPEFEALFKRKLPGVKVERVSFISEV